MKVLLGFIVFSISLYSCELNKLITKLKNEQRNSYAHTEVRDNLKKTKNYYEYTKQRVKNVETKYQRILNEKQ